MHSWVVSCIPVPKAVPGSIWMSSLSLCSSGTVSQVGFMRISSTVKGLKYCFQLLIQSLSSVSDSSMVHAPRSVNILSSLSPSRTFRRVSAGSSSPSR